MIEAHSMPNSGGEQAPPEPEDFILGDELREFQESSRRLAGRHLPSTAMYNLFFLGQEINNRQQDQAGEVPDGDLAGNRDVLSVFTPDERKSAEIFLTWANNGLRDHGYKEEIKLDIESKIDWAKDRLLRFFESVEQREDELDGHISDFKQLMYEVVTAGNAPVSKEQLDDRLAGYQIGFSDPLNMKPHALGHELLHEGRIEINIDTPPEKLRHAVFHEMVHAISGTNLVRDEGVLGVKASKHGLSQTGKQGWVENEAVVDFIAEELASGKQIDMGISNSADKIKEQWATFAESANTTNTYYGEKIVTLLSNFRISPGYLYEALFKADYDPFEEYQLAGANALSDLKAKQRGAYGPDSPRMQRFGEVEVLLQEGSINEAIDLASELFVSYDAN